MTPTNSLDRWKIDGDVAILQLGKGRTLLIDASDLEAVGRYSIQAAKRHHTIYARVDVRDEDEKLRAVFVHHLIAGYPINGLVIDHLDRNGLNNTSKNLRVATKKQNAQNTVKKSGRGYRGVFQVGNSFRSTVAHEVLGYFRSGEEAARAYDRRAIEKYGEHARINFPNEVNALSNPAAGLPAQKFERIFGQGAT